MSLGNAKCSKNSRGHQGRYGQMKLSVTLKSTLLCLSQSVGLTIYPDLDFDFHPNETSKAWSLKQEKTIHAFFQSCQNQTQCYSQYRGCIGGTCGSWKKYSVTKKAPEETRKVDWLLNEDVQGWGPCKACSQILKKAANKGHSLVKN